MPLTVSNPKPQHYTLNAETLQPLALEAPRPGPLSPRLGELDIDAQARQGNFELVEGAAVQRRGGHQVISLAADGGDGEELRRHAGGDGHRTHTPLERGHTLLEHVVGRVLSQGGEIRV